MYFPYLPYVFTVYLILINEYFAVPAFNHRPYFNYNSYMNGLFSTKNINDQCGPSWSSKLHPYGRMEGLVSLMVTNGNDTGILGSIHKHDQHTQYSSKQLISRLSD